ncbi:sugar ABC transporter ATP-binding protein [Cohnella yongneupensis]|uniref:Sugar ABC transporter ATP-binding protein n=1 Tax=Cohnella yongneupensis TaxID=425006 RepID=A0ABW0QWS5_9BACL
MLEMFGITKKFLNTLALDQVDFSLRKGEVHALVGPNGAGKSTLMKIVNGLLTPDEGSILFEGHPKIIQSVEEAQRLGIAMLPQEPILVPDLSIAENIFLGTEETRAGFWLRSKSMKLESKRLLKILGFRCNPNTPVRKLSYSEQFIISIAKALSVKSKILIMDEPTSCLSEDESGRLFGVIRKLKHEGVSIVYITHRIKEVMQICDRVTFLRDGRNVATREVAGMSEEEAVRMAVGRGMEHYFPPVLDETDGNVLLKVQGFTQKPYFQDIDFTLYQGEILGIAGYIGSGKSQLAKSLFGEEKRDQGRMLWRNREVEFKRRRSASDLRFGFVNHNRHDEGLFMEHGVNRNLTISALDKLMPYYLGTSDKENEAALDAVIELDIKIQHLDQEVQYLSGGNQQKVMVGKWLIADCDLYLMDEPTRGVDLGTKGEIYGKLHELAASGKGVIVFSSDIHELIGLCTRILVMYQGRITAEVHHTEASAEKIMRIAAGGQA